MMFHWAARLSWLAVFVFQAASVLAGPGALKAGVGKITLTPAEDMWLAGYAARTSPSTGKVHDLYAKALAFEDEAGVRSVILTTDLLGLPRAVALQVAAAARARFGLTRERLILTFSHTHCGPVI